MGTMIFAILLILLAVLFLMAYLGERIIRLFNELISATERLHDAVIICIADELARNERKPNDRES
jgi:hypothetical protein